MNHYIRAFCLWGFLLGGSVSAQEWIEGEIRLEATSPSSHVSIRRVNLKWDDSGEHVPYKFEFCDDQGKFLGTIDTGDTTKNSFEAVWNADETKVAVRMAYGTKMNALCLFHKTKSGIYEKIPFQIPNFPSLDNQNGDSVSEADCNLLGNWKGDTFLFYAGKANMNGDNVELYYFIPLEVKIDGKHVSVKALAPVGWLTSEQMEKFQKDTGAH